MEYKQVKIIFNPFSTDLSELLIAKLSGIQYEAFAEEDDYFNAYIPKKLYNAGSLSEILKDPVFNSIKISTELTDIPDINWNALWEKSYEPILIDNICSILAPFHPETGTQYTIRIEPKMSFGTGHHETTRLMIQQIYSTDCKAKTILDMGCGTGVLGIFAHMRGASFITAIDIDEWAYTNSIENFKVNQIPESEREILKGDVLSIPGTSYDIILANINRNILLEDMNNYLSHLKNGGLLIISGLLNTDRKPVMQKATTEGISFVSELCENKWISLKFSK